MLLRCVIHPSDDSRNGDSQKRYGRQLKKAERVVNLDTFMCEDPYSKGLS